MRVELPFLREPSQSELATDITCC